MKRFCPLNTRGIVSSMDTESVDSIMWNRKGPVRKLLGSMRKKLTIEGDHLTFM